MLAQKPSVSTIDVTHRKQLEYLYERRTSVDALIESLQKYDRFHSETPDKKRRPA
jgi:hypothetical protein